MATIPTAAETRDFAANLLWRINHAMLSLPTKPGEFPGGRVAEAAALAQLAEASSKAFALWQAADNEERRRPVARQRLGALGRIATATKKAR